MPVVAESNIPMTATVTAMPPFTLPNSLTKFSINRCATPERSSIKPIKMNIGNATSTQLFITSQMRSTTRKL